jgi:pyridoxine/pyridoxamine 5'-phosphate oxidase
VQQLDKNSKASLLFYHPKKLLQIKVEGHMELVRSGKAYEDYWSRVQGVSQKDYITKHAPGTPIDQPDQVDYKEDEHHFCVLKLIPETLEYLQLSRPNHIRARFDKSNDWGGHYLNP